MKKAKFMLLPLLLMVVAMFFGCDLDGGSSSSYSSTKKLPAVEGIYAEAVSESAITISFDDVPGAAYYIIEWGVSDYEDSPTQTSGVISHEDSGKIRISAYTKHSESNPYKIGHTFKPATEYSLWVYAADEDGNIGDMDCDLSVIETFVPNPVFILTQDTTTSFTIDLYSAYVISMDMTITGTDGTNYRETMIPDPYSGEWKRRIPNLKRGATYTVSFRSGNSAGGGRYMVPCGSSITLN